MTALMHAVEDGTGFIDSVDALIAAGANLDAVDEHGNTALMFALNRKREAIAARLREAGASEQGVGDIALMNASSEGDLAKVQRLLAEGDVNVNCVMQMTPLTLACHYGHADVVRALIVAGADVNLANSPGSLTPLIRAAYGGYVEAVRGLLEAGADVTAQVEGVGTALDYALMRQTEKGKTTRNEVIQLLEAAGTPTLVAKAKRKKKGG
jgi:uncharacterized protein